MQRAPRTAHATTPTAAATQQPSIRLINATPGSSNSVNQTPSVPIGGWGGPPNSSTARLSGHESSDSASPAKKKKSRIAPKRSKLFSSNSVNASTQPGLTHQKSRDLSDVVRRVGGGSSSTLNLLSSSSQHAQDHGRENSVSLARKGFEIYVDSNQCEEDMEVVVVRKVKSRGGLRGLFGNDDKQTRNVLGDATNIGNGSVRSAKSPVVPNMSGSVRSRAGENFGIPNEEVVSKEGKEKEGNNNSKWWTIGRGRKDSKDKEKDKKDKRAKTPDTLKMGSTRRFFSSSNGPKSAELPPRSNTPDIASYLNSQAPRSAGLPPRSMTPEPFSTVSPQESIGRNRAASFDVLRSTPSYSYETDPKLRAFYPPTFAPNPNSRPSSPAPSSPNPTAVNPTPANTLRYYPGQAPTLTKPPLEHNPFSEAFASQQPPRSTSPGPMRGVSPTPTGTIRSASPAPSVALRSATPTVGGFLAPPVPAEPKQDASNSGSIAFRAIRSVKSLARMGGSAVAEELANQQNSETGKKKEKKKSKKDTIRNAPKSSSSSFEVGAASPMRPKVEKKKSILGLGLGLPASMRIKGSSATPSEVVSAIIHQDENAARRSSDILRSDKPRNDRLSVDSAYLLQTREMQATSRTPSVSSTSSSSLDQHAHKETRGRDSVSSGVSSLRPNSVASSARSSMASGVGRVLQDRRASNASSSGGVGYSYYEGISRRESYDSNAALGIKRESLDVAQGTVVDRRVSSSSGSVRWDEAKLENVKKTVADSRRSSSSAAGSQPQGEKKRENRHSAEGRKRTGISDVFPGLSSEGENGAMMGSENGSEVDGGDYPMLMLESATSDGHGSEIQTPEKKKRKSRPISEQMPVHDKRRGAVFDDSGVPSNVKSEGVLLMLDAATNDLEKLIDVLDLEATPANTPNSVRTGIRGYEIGEGSPGRNYPLFSKGSVSSLKRSNQRIESSGERTFRIVPRKASETSIKPKNSLAKLPKSTLGPKKGSEISISSLRPYAQSRKNTLPSSGSESEGRPKVIGSSESSSPTAVVGKQIAPWTTLAALTAKKVESPVAGAAPSHVPVFKPPQGHIRGKLSLDGTPGPMPDTPPVLQPLKPSMSKQHISSTLRPKKEHNEPPSPTMNFGTVRASMVTFGQRSVSSRAGSNGSSSDEAASAAPPKVFTKPDRERKKSSPMHLQVKTENRNSIPIPPETKRVLGMTGTMGGSDSSAHRMEVDENDPDSDIPDELQVILSGGSDEERSPVEFDFGTDTYGKPLPSPGLPPGQPLPMPSTMDSQPPSLPSLPQFRANLIDEEENHADVETSDSDSNENHTKKSFDFTGELRELNESGGRDRRSFVEQLENAFKTPAKVDLRYNFGEGVEDGLLRVDVPPVPKLPSEFANTSAMSEDVSLDAELEEDFKIVEAERTTFQQVESVSRIVDMKEPTLLPGSDSLATTATSESFEVREIQQHLRTRPSGSSSSSRPSDGELDRSFKFGRGPKIPPVLQQQASPSSTEGDSRSNSDSLEDDSVLDSIYGQAAHQRPSNVPGHLRSFSTNSMSADRDSIFSSIYGQAEHQRPSNIPGHVRSLSAGSMSIDDDSILNSILAHAATRPRVNSDVSLQSRRRSQNMSANSGVTMNTKSRPTSTISFQGLDSFEEVRRGFEFTNDRPMFYPPSAANNRRRGGHVRDPSLFSIASVSSYGHGANNGLADPFEYALPSLRERPSNEDMTNMTNMSYSVDDTFSFMNHASRRQRVDSDSSSFYFRPALAAAAARGHRRQDSNMSVVSQGPPISRYNRSFSHRRNDSVTSAGSSSIAHSYAMHGAHAGRAAWARHRPGDPSIDSISSEISFSRLGRPGIGDKMFDTAVPLTSISASPSEGTFDEREEMLRMNRTSYDSIMDTQRMSSAVEDSLFDKTGVRNSASSESFFGYDGSHPSQPHLLPPTHFRPVSALSMYSETSPMKEDDTMISMLGGGHVRRRSIGSMINTSPCVRMEKRKHSALQDAGPQIVEKPSIASTSSFQFGGERMIRAQQGLLQRQSLEESALMAEGEDLSLSYVAPVFTRPSLSSRSRSSTCTSSSECPTPPLSASDGSISEFSPQSSLDLSHINFALANTIHPAPAVARPRARARPQGQGHRRRFSQARASRSSVYETIDEEFSSSPASKHSKTSSPTVHPPVLIADPNRSSMGSMHGSSLWDDEQGIMALRRYYALRDEAHDTVTESRKVWVDTPVSLFALQSFDPPRHAEGMQALLRKSVDLYQPLPHELHPRRVRSRTSSRPSPYPKEVRNIKPSSSPENDSQSSIGSIALKQLSMNIPNSPAPALDILKPFSPLIVEPEQPNSPFALPPKDVRPRVGSAARRSALGWSKRNNKSSTGQKENTSQGALMSPSASLRLNRPTPAARRRTSKRA